jgi:hypothetical protein
LSRAAASMTTSNALNNTAVASNTT